MSKIPKLKPCPHCGDKRLWTTCAWPTMKKFRIECGHCGFCGGAAYTKRGAYRKWNRMKDWREICENT